MDVSLTIKRATDILFLRNPLGTALGAMLGYLSHGVVIAVWAYEKLSVLYYIGAGVFGFNIVPFLRKGGANIDPSIEEALDTIDEAVKRGELSTLYSKAMYKKAVDQYLEKKVKSSSSIISEDEAQESKD